MSLIDPFPMDQNRIIQDLARRIAALEAKVGQAQGLQISQASDAFLIPVSSPGSSPTGAYLYADSSGQLFWSSDGWGPYSLAVFVPTASEVTTLTATAGSTDDTISAVGGSYDQTVLNNNFRDLAAKINAIITALQNVDLMDS